jgi:hypothetical protein
MRERRHERRGATTVGFSSKGTANTRLLDPRMASGRYKREVHNSGAARAAPA